MSNWIYTDPLFYLVAIPAILLIGISKSGFGTGFGSLAVPLMALAVTVPQAAAILMPVLLVNFLKAVQMGFDVMQDSARTNQARDLVRSQVFKDIEPEMFAEVWEASRIAAPKNLLIAPKQLEIFMDVNNRFSKDKLDMATVEDHGNTLAQLGFEVAPMSATTLAVLSCTFGGYMLLAARARLLFKHGDAVMYPTVVKG